MSCKERERKRDIDSRRKRESEEAGESEKANERERQKLGSKINLRKLVHASMIKIIKAAKFADMKK